VHQWILEHTALNHICVATFLADTTRMNRSKSTNDARRIRKVIARCKLMVLTLVLQQDFLTGTPSALGGICLFPYTHVAEEGGVMIY